VQSDSEYVQSDETYVQSDDSMCKVLNKEAHFYPCIEKLSYPLLPSPSRLLLDLVVSGCRVLRTHVHKILAQSTHSD
jgi:hypothetical protein